MRRGNDRRMLKNPMIARVILGSLVVIMILLGSSVWGVYGKYRDAKEKKDELVREFGELQQREVSLKEKLDQLKTERGVEEEIRSKFQVARAGEGVILIVDPKQSTDTAPLPPQNIWGRLLGFFGF